MRKRRIYGQDRAVVGWMTEDRFQREGWRELEQEVWVIDLDPEDAVRRCGSPDFEELLVLGNWVDDNEG